MGRVKAEAGVTPKALGPECSREFRARVKESALPFRRLPPRLERHLLLLRVLRPQWGAGRPHRGPLHPVLTRISGGCGLLVASRGLTRLVLLPPPPAP